MAVDLSLTVQPSVAAGAVEADGAAVDEAGASATEAAPPHDAARSANMMSGRTLPERIVGAYRPMRARV
ncbi:MAG TPA: hypothetical protein VKR80_07890 [Candidatus Limnocylindria bacterium]|nr:hypothetical protein [Candidatus Limnocylindria bacterium]